MRLTRRRALAGLGTACVGVGGIFGYSRLGGSSSTARPTALVAGSLLHVSRALGGAAVEAHGSAAVRRLIVAGMRSPDAVAVADPRLLRGIADRATLFATNALVLAYDPSSPHADAIRHDWRSAIVDDRVRVGRTDPAVDPLGYRTVMALDLAENRSGLDASAVLDGSTVVAETDVLNVLRGGGLDAAFVYRNMAVERDVPAVELPDAIDFSNPADADTYATVTYEHDGRTIRGAPIRYAATALTDLGAPWIERLVSAGDTLTASGFVIPSAYPRRGVPIPGSGGS